MKHRNENINLLMEKYFEGELSEEERFKFFETLNKNKQGLELFYEEAMFRVDLYHWSEQSENIVPFEQHKTLEGSKQFYIRPSMLFHAAALLVILFALWYLITLTKPVIRNGFFQEETLHVETQIPDNTHQDEAENNTAKNTKKETIADPDNISPNKIKENAPIDLKSPSREGIVEQIESESDLNPPLDPKIEKQIEPELKLSQEPEGELSQDIIKEIDKEEPKPVKEIISEEGPQEKIQKKPKEAKVTPVKVPEVIAKIISTKGVVKIKNINDSSAKEIYAHTGQVINTDMNIQTFSNSECVIELIDKSRLHLYENTEIKRIRDLQKQNRKSKYSKYVDLGYGKCEFDISRQKYNKKFLTNMEYTQIIVLGTKYVITSDKGQMRLKVTKGRVLAFHKKIGSKVHLVKAGTTAVIKKSRATRIFKSK